MDESYLKLARSCVDLGDTIEMVCRSAATADQRVSALRSRAERFLQFGHTLPLVSLLGTPTSTQKMAMVKAAELLFGASATLKTSTSDIESVRAAVLSVNSALSDVLPGIPDIPDLPKPEPVPPEDILEITWTPEDPSPHRTRRG